MTNTNCAAADGLSSLTLHLQGGPTREEYLIEWTGVKLLGILDVENTPCARDALLHGAGGSVIAGLVHFLATSRVKRSFDVGMAGFMLTTLGSWFYCRYNNAKLRVQQKVIQDGIKNKVMYEGTSRDPTRKTREQ